VIFHSYVSHYQRVTYLVGGFFLPLWWNFTILLVSLRATQVETTKGLAKARARVNKTMVICTAAKEALKPDRGKWEECQKPRKKTWKISQLFTKKNICIHIVLLKYVYVWLSYTSVEVIPAMWLMTSRSLVWKEGICPHSNVYWMKKNTLPIT
jgi:hypothetical protein